MAGVTSFDFKGSRVLVTGGTSGIGEAAAIAFARASARVVIVGRSLQRARAIVAAAEELPGSIAFVEADLALREQCDLAVSEAVSVLGGLDAVVNSAGVIYHAVAEDTTDDQWSTTMNVNVNAVFHVSRAVLPRLRETRGTLVNIASDAALTGSSHLVAYCASKGAVLQMTRAMARDHAHEGIRIVPVCPGDVDTPMLRGEFRDRGLDADTGLRESAEAVPLNRVCTPAEVADMVLYACSDSAAFVTGYPLVLDGGNRA